MPMYQNNDYTLLQIKEKNFINKFKPLNCTHTKMEINIRIYIYIYIYG